MTTNQSLAWSSKKLGIACVLLWLAMMGATLWPFNPYPRNRVNWLAQSNGVELGKAGVIGSASRFPAVNSHNDHSCSMEIWLSADSQTDVSTILSFYAGERPPHFELRQYGTGVLIFYELLNASHRRVNGEIDVDHLFERGRPVLLTVSSGSTGTKAYINGKLAQFAPGHRLSADNFSGNLVIGTSPWSYDSWSGELRGLAFYAHELDETEISEHYRLWTEQKPLPVIAAEHDLARYLFNEHLGSVIHDQSESAPDLNIPIHFQVPDKAILAPPWKELMPFWIYTEDLARNVVGFIPLGILLYIYFSHGAHRARAALFTILLGAATSLLIEVLQAFIPQRVSGMTDVITNTLGTGLGVLLLQPRAIKVMLVDIGILRA